MLIPPKDPASLAKAILSVKESGDKGKAIGERASEFVLKNFDEKQTLEKTMNIICSLIKQKRDIE